MDDDVIGGSGDLEDDVIVGLDVLEEDVIDDDAVLSPAAVSCLVEDVSCFM